MAAYTLQEILDGLSDNADFEEVGSVTKAKAFVTWCRHWMFIAPHQASNNGSSLVAKTEQMQKQLERAQAYVAANNTAATAGRTSRFSLENFRD